MSNEVSVQQVNNITVGADCMVVGREKLAHCSWIITLSPSLS